MKVATISETKNQLSALLDFVREGETILILDRKKPIARIVPAGNEEGADEESRLWQLERSGLVQTSKHAPSRQIIKEAPPSWKGDKQLSDSLHEEREPSRDPGICLTR